MPIIMLVFVNYVHVSKKGMNLENMKKHLNNYASNK